MLRSLIASLFIATAAQSKMVYTPAKMDANTNVVVVVHGCLQSAEAMAMGTGWNQKADENNLVIIYPQVKEKRHPLDCWSWYSPINQKKNSGELKQIYDDLQKTTQELKLQKPKVFLAGISSGGAMVSSLMACYPKTFTAAAVHSGPSYGLARNVLEASNVLKMGPRVSFPYPKSCRPDKYEGRVLVLQGSADEVVHPSHADRVILDFVGPRTSERTTRGKSGGLDYRTTDYLVDGQLKGRKVMIEGLGHEWAGYKTNLRHNQLLGEKTQLPFFSEKGPSSTDLIWQFFAAPVQSDRRNRCCRVVE